MSAVNGNGNQNGANAPYDLIPPSNTLAEYLSQQDGRLVAANAPGPSGRIVSAFQSGLTGCHVDSEGAPEWSRIIARYARDKLRANSRNGWRAEDAIAADLVGKGAGQRAVHFQHAMKLDPKIFQGSQQYNNCCAWGTREIAGACIAVDVVERGELHEYQGRPGTACIYANRGSKADQGMALDDGAGAVHLNGIGIEKVYPGYDLTTQGKDEAAGVKWGGSNVPKDLHDLIKGDLIEQVSEVQEEEAVKDILFGGSFILTGSTRTAGGTGDPICRITSIGGHAQALIGYDDTDEFREWYAKTTGKKLAATEWVGIFDQSWGCYDAKTEVLTNEGWKLFRNLLGSEELATLNQQTHELEYQRASQLHQYDYSGNLLHFHGRGFDAMVTPNHNMLVSGCARSVESPLDGGYWNLRRADSLPKFIRFKKNAKWSGADVPCHECAGMHVPMNDWLQFLGYFLSEGHACKPQKQYRVRNGKLTHQYAYVTGISQKSPSKEMVGLMERIPFSFSTQSGRGWTANRKALWEELRVFGKAHEKYIPDYVWDCSSEQLKILFSAMMEGDGSYGKTATSDTATYFTSSRRLAGDFQRLLLHIGYSGDIRTVDRRGRDNGTGGITRHVEYQIGIRRIANYPGPRLGVVPKPTPYVGKVYCATVPNHVLYVRREGKAFWCGNSDWITVNNWPEQLWGPRPEGAFVLKGKDAMQLITIWGQALAMCRVAGFPLRKLPDWGASQYL